MYQHFKTVAEQVKLPVILYNVPADFGKLAAKQPWAVAQIDNIVAIKKAKGIWIKRQS